MATRYETLQDIAERVEITLDRYYDVQSLFDYRKAGVVGLCDAIAAYHDACSDHREAVEAFEALKASKPSG